MNVVRPGASLPIEVDATAASGVSGDLISIDVLATAKEGTDDLGTTTSFTSRVVDPGVATITNLRTISEDGRVVVTWAASGAASTITVQRAQQVSGPYVDLPTSEVSFAGAVNAQNDFFADTGVVNGVVYHYRILTEGAGGQRSYAGPVLGAPQFTIDPSAPTLTLASASGGAISLGIAGGGERLLDGDHIERRISDSSGWTQLTTATTGAGVFVDDTISLGTTYEYRAWAIDRFGNTSPRGNTLIVETAADTTLVGSRVLAFEDMIGPGENDWDYNDFIVYIDTYERRDEVGVSTIEMVYEPLARGAGYVHEFRQRIPIVGGWTATVTLYSADGDELTQTVSAGSGTLDVTIFEETLDALGAISGSYANTPFVRARRRRGLRAPRSADALPGDHRSHRLARARRGAPGVGRPHRSVAYVQ